MNTLRVAVSGPAPAGCAWPRACSGPAPTSPSTSGTAAWPAGARATGCTWTRGQAWPCTGVPAAGFPGGLPGHLRPGQQAPDRGEREAAGAARAGQPGTPLDPYAPATLSAPVDRLTLREVLAARVDGRIAFGHELARYGDRRRTACGCTSPRAARRPTRTCWSARTASSPRSAASTCRTPRRPIPEARCIYGKTPLRDLATLPSFVAPGFTAVVGGRIGMAVGPGALPRASRGVRSLARVRLPDVGRGRRPPGVRRARTSSSTTMDPAGPARPVRRADQDLAPRPAGPARPGRHRRDVRRPGARLATGAAPGRRSRVTVLGDAIHAMSPHRRVPARTPPCATPRCSAAP